MNCVCPAAVPCLHTPLLAYPLLAYPPCLQTPCLHTPCLHTPCLHTPLLAKPLLAYPLLAYPLLANPLLAQPGAASAECTRGIYRGNAFSCTHAGVEQAAWAALQAGGVPQEAAGMHESAGERARLAGPC